MTEYKSNLQIYKFYFIKLSEKFAENKSTKFFLINKDKINIF